MKTEVTLVMDIDLPGDITRIDLQQSIEKTTEIWLSYVDKTVSATVKAVDFKETQ